MSASSFSEDSQKSENSDDERTMPDVTNTNNSSPTQISVSSTSSIKLFVGGVSWDTTSGSLHDYFAKFGPIEESSLMRDRKTGQPRGFAFVSMRNAVDAEEILATKNHILDGRHVDVKPALPKGSAHADFESGAEHAIHQTKLFVAGLSQATEASDLLNAFSRFGKVRDARIMLDRHSSSSRGFGFVEFEDNSVVLRLLRELPVVECDGRQVEFKLALPKNPDGHGINGKFTAINNFRGIPSRYRGRNANGYDSLGGLVYHPYISPMFRASDPSPLIYGGIPMVAYDNLTSGNMHMADPHSGYGYMHREGTMIGTEVPYQQAGMPSPNPAFAGPQPYAAYHMEYGPQQFATANQLDAPLPRMVMQQHHQQYTHYQVQPQQQQPLKEKQIDDKNDPIEDPIPLEAATSTRA